MQKTNRNIKKNYHRNIFQEANAKLKETDDKK